MAPHPTRRHRGFMLVEMLTVCVVAGLLAALAWPSYQGWRLRSARLDAVAALTRVHSAQEQHRALHGLYADGWSAVGLSSPLSPQGHYELQLVRTGAEAYRATATARGAQAADRACPVLTLEVRSGFPNEGPSAACWQR